MFICSSKVIDAYGFWIFVIISTNKYAIIFDTISSEVKNRCQFHGHFQSIIQLVWVINIYPLMLHKVHINTLYIVLGKLKK